MPASPESRITRPSPALAWSHRRNSKSQLFGAADQRQMPAAQGLVTAFDGAFPQDHPRAFDVPAPLQVRQFHRAIFEQIADQVAGRLRNDDRPGVGRRLQARRQIRDVAHHRRLARRSGADVIAHDHEAAVDADADLEGAGRAGQGVEARDRIDEGQARPDRPLGVGFIGLRVAEIDQGAVAHIAGDKAVECGDQAAGQFVKVGDDLAEIFGVKPLAQRRRPDQVDEHHGHEPALGRLAQPPRLVTCRAWTGERRRSRRKTACPPGSRYRRRRTATAAPFRNRRRTSCRWRRQRRSVDISFDLQCRTAGELYDVQR